MSVWSTATAAEALQHGGQAYSCHFGFQVFSQNGFGMFYYSKCPWKHFI